MIFLILSQFSKYIFLPPSLLGRPRPRLTIDGFPDKLKGVGKSSMATGEDAVEVAFEAGPS